MPTTDRQIPQSGTEAKAWIHTMYPLMPGICMLARLSPWASRCTPCLRETRSHVELNASPDSHNSPCLCCRSTRSASRSTCRTGSRSTTTKVPRSANTVAHCCGGSPGRGSNVRVRLFMMSLLVAHNLGCSFQKAHVYKYCYFWQTTNDSDTGSKDNSII